MYPMLPLCQVLEQASFTLAFFGEGQMDVMCNVTTHASGIHHRRGTIASELVSYQIPVPTQSKSSSCSLDNLQTHHNITAPFCSESWRLQVVFLRALTNHSHRAGFEHEKRLRLRPSPSGPCTCPLPQCRQCQGSSGASLASDCADWHETQQTVQVSIWRTPFCRVPC